MTQNDEYYNKTNLDPLAAYNKDLEDEQGDQDGEAKGGKSGQVEFHDFLAPGKSRDESLSFDEKKHLLLIHKNGNEIRVKKAKDKIAAILQLKGKVGNFIRSIYQYGSSLGEGGIHNQYKPNPALFDKPQFSGATDKQVNPFSLEHDAVTNEAESLDPKLKYQKRYEPELQPRFHPTPTPQANKLTRS